MNHLAYMKLGDAVEDRSTYAGHGHICYLTGNDIYVRFEDGSEEVVNAELFTYYNERHWIF